MTNSMQIMTLHVMLLLKVNVIKKNSSGLWQMQNPQCVHLRFKVTSHKLFKRPMLEQCLLYNVIINVCVHTRLWECNLNGLFIVIYYAGQGVWE